ncbi:MAG: hypothetical protein IMY73_01935 [Bacteroidetes bacterium]|nr:hypothetical protein [Bacteroidota bacterium]
MKKEEIDRFELIQGQLEGLYTEISILTKKTPTDCVNLFKISYINEIIVEANKILSSAYKPSKSFEIFNTDDLPTNSDVVFILSQYLKCFEKLRRDNIKTGLNSYWYWNIKDSNISKRTYSPKV